MAIVLRKFAKEVRKKMRVLAFSFPKLNFGALHNLFSSVHRALAYVKGFRRGVFPARNRSSAGLAQISGVLDYAVLKSILQGPFVQSPIKLILA